MLVVDVKTGGCQVFLCVFYCELQAMPTALTASALISVVEAAAETCKKSQKHLAVGETSHGADATMSRSFTGAIHHTRPTQGKRWMGVLMKT